MTIVSPITVKQGDFGASATLAFTVIDPNNLITSLSGYTVYLLVWSDPANPIIKGLCALDSAMSCHYVPGASDYNLPGLYSWELELEGSRLSTETGIFIIKPSPTH